MKYGDFSLGNFQRKFIFIRSIYIFCRPSSFNFKIHITFSRSRRNSSLLWYPLNVWANSNISSWMTGSATTGRIKWVNTDQCVNVRLDDVQWSTIVVATWTLCIRIISKRAEGVICYSCRSIIWLTNCIGQYTSSGISKIRWNIT